MNTPLAANQTCRICLGNFLGNDDICADCHLGTRPGVYTRRRLERQLEFECARASTDRKVLLGVIFCQLCVVCAMALLLGGVA